MLVHGNHAVFNYTTGETHVFGTSQRQKALAFRKFCECLELGFSVSAYWGSLPCWTWVPERPDDDVRRSVRRKLDALERYKTWKLKKRREREAQ